jgi:chemotaxis protein methyltransferase CheR
VRTPATPAMTQEAYLLLNELISERFGIEFPEHRRELLATRLRPRLASLRLPSYWDYYLHLRTDTNGEKQRLAELVTNNETFFFRETRQIESFLKEAVPLLKPEGGIPQTPRVLCAGCSSGEEPYTMNILAHPLSLAIDAFDIDAGRIDAARRAEYGRSSVRLATAEQLERHFSPSGPEQWSLRSTWRRNIRFSWGNIVELETFRGGELYDAVFCRNVLIYFSPASLRRAVRHFAAVLRPGGLLFLGATESIIGLSESFETIRLSGTIAYRRVAS